MRDEPRVHVILKQRVPEAFPSAKTPLWTLRFTMPGPPTRDLRIQDITNEVYLVNQFDITYLRESSLYEIDLEERELELSAVEAKARRDAGWECEGDAPAQDVSANDNDGEEDYSNEEL